MKAAEDQRRSPVLVDALASLHDIARKDLDTRMPPIECATSRMPGIHQSGDRLQIFAAESNAFACAANCGAGSVGGGCESLSGGPREATSK
jgi:hypothetical protein